MCDNDLHMDRVQTIWKMSDSRLKSSSHQNWSSVATKKHQKRGIFAAIPQPRPAHVMPVLWAAVLFQAVLSWPKPSPRLGPEQDKWNFNRGLPCDIKSSPFQSPWMQGAAVRPPQPGPPTASMSPNVYSQGSGNHIPPVTHRWEPPGRAGQPELLALLEEEISFVSDIWAIHLGQEGGLQARHVHSPAPPPTPISSSGIQTKGPLSWGLGWIEGRGASQRTHPG